MSLSQTEVLSFLEIAKPVTAQNVTNMPVNPTYCLEWTVVWRWIHGCRSKNVREEWQHHYCVLICDACYIRAKEHEVESVQGKRAFFFKVSSRELGLTVMPLLSILYVRTALYVYGVGTKFRCGFAPHTPWRALSDYWNISL